MGRAALSAGALAGALLLLQAGPVACGHGGSASTRAEVSPTAAPAVVPDGAEAPANAAAAPGEPATEAGGARAEEVAADAGPGETLERLRPIQHAACELPPVESRDESRDDAATFLFSPARPREGRPLRVVVVAERNLEASRLVVEDESGDRPVAPLDAWGGPPWAWTATLPSAAAGKLRFCLSSAGGDRPIACAEVVVEAGGDASRPAPASGVWPVARAWDRPTETLFAAWIARLFHAEPGLTIGWRPLHKALRDPQRNLLHDHLGLGEDDPDALTNAVLEPDCGDTPYFLRAYFAWKLRLPFAAHLCPRGGVALGPGCDGRVFTNLAPAWDGVADPVERFDRFLADGVARYVHSGTARTLPEDLFSDFYPVALSRAALRPGTIFVDPRGHILVLTRWLAGTRERIGTLFAIDGHPDQSISHKRFSPSTFFFTTRVRTGGFKAFRPLRFRDGAFCFVTDAELEADPPVRAYAMEQYELADDAAFYARVDGLLNPYPPDPVQAYRDRMELLVELLVDREAAVRVAVDYMESTAWARIPIPDGAAIFTTSGPWESYATPARDLRLLVAADELGGFPLRVRESPGSFHVPPEKTPDQVDGELAAAWEQGRQELKFSYRRSDGSTWTLTLGEFRDRLRAFETAYNPNDCPEVRWGAPDESDELSTCTHRSSAGQQRLMAGYRMWFSARLQPLGL